MVTIPDELAARLLEVLVERELGRRPPAPNPHIAGPDGRCDIGAESRAHLTRADLSPLSEPEARSLMCPGCRRQHGHEPGCVVAGAMAEQAAQAEKPLEERHAAHSPELVHDGVCELCGPLPGRVPACQHEDPSQTCGLCEGEYVEPTIGEFSVHFPGDTFANPGGSLENALGLCELGARTGDGRIEKHAIHRARRRLALIRTAREEHRRPRSIDDLCPELRCSLWRKHPGEHVLERLGAEA